MDSKYGFSIRKFCYKRGINELFIQEMDQIT